ncbi:hypothetical protein EQG79_14215 [Spirosoma sordidisoli]|uniref:Uncharacterized protein n=2 Tax=Spirosoma sordidisoli TaxID=2502893 RepID=A0A4Q2UKK7_9BACT|nr:hypothetical protein EQG79_14215 [Spirosoma sordidisoli]
MSVTLVQAPDTYALTKGGRMRYVFSGQGRFETTGTKAVAGIIFYGPIVDGETIGLRWNGKTTSVTARTNPTRPDEFPAGDGSAAYVDSLLPFFRGLYAFRKDWVVTRESAGNLHGITLTARRPGKAYNLTYIPGKTPELERKYTVGQSVMGTDALVRDRYGIYLEVYLQKPGTTGADRDLDYELIGDGGSHIECDADGVAKYDLGDLLHSYLSADVPDFQGQGGQVAQQSARQYYVAYGEAWGQPITVQQVVEDQTRHAYLGGADWERRADTGYNLTTALLGADAGADKSLLMGSPARIARLDEAHFLTFINLREQASSVKLEIRMTFDDDSTHVRTGIQAAIDYQPGTKVAFPVGIAQLNLREQVPAGKFLREYSCRLVTLAGGYLSRAYRYVVDYDNRPYRRQFSYLNSLGAFDSIMTWGKGSYELQLFYEQAERVMPAGYEPTAAQFVQYNLSRQQAVEVASGWQPLPELQRWDDFYCSAVRFQVLADRVLAIGLTNKQIRQQRDGDTQFAHVFSYVYQHRDEFYTDDFPEGGETLPPVQAPAGSVYVLPPLPVFTRDPTVPQAARDLTTPLLDKLKIVAERPNPETLGFLKQPAADALYRRDDEKISYRDDLIDKPTTREESGLTDVYTIPEAIQMTNLILKNTVGVHPILSSWTDEVEPA